jgi:hypothetical protein
LAASTTGGIPGTVATPAGAAGCAAADAAGRAPAGAGAAVWAPAVPTMQATATASDSWASFVFT